MIDPKPLTDIAALRDRARSAAAGAGSPHFVPMALHAVLDLIEALAARLPPTSGAEPATAQQAAEGVGVPRGDDARQHDAIEVVPARAAPGDRARPRGAGEGEMMAITEEQLADLRWRWQREVDDVRVQTSTDVLVQESVERARVGLALLDDWERLRAFEAAAPRLIGCRTTIPGCVVEDGEFCGDDPCCHDEVEDFVCPDCGGDPSADPAVHDKGCLKHSLLTTLDRARTEPDSGREGEQSAGRGPGR